MDGIIHYVTLWDDFFSLSPWDPSKLLLIGPCPCCTAFHSIYVSYSYQNKWAQSWRLKAIETYSLLVLEARSSTSRCHPSHTAHNGSRGESPLASSSFCWLQPLLGLRLHKSHLQLYFKAGFFTRSSLLSHIRVLIIEFRVHSDNSEWSYRKILNHTVKNFFQ